MIPKNFQWLGVYADEHCYDARELAHIVSRMFAWIPESKENDLKNTRGRDLFQQSVIDEHCRSFLNYCLFGGLIPQMEVWWWIVIRVRLYYALDTLNEIKRKDDGWCISLTPEGVVQYVYDLITLSWVVDGLRWLLIERADIPLYVCRA